MCLYKILHQGNGVCKCKSQGSHKWTSGRQQLGVNSNHNFIYSRKSCPLKTFGFFAHGAVLLKVVLP